MIGISALVGVGLLLTL